MLDECCHTVGVVTDEVKTYSPFNAQTKVMN